MVRFSLDFEKEPIAVALCVGVWLQIQVGLAWLNLDSQIEIAAFEHRVEDELAAWVLGGVLVCF